MSDFSSEISSSTPRHSCECYKKLLPYDIPLYIKDENDFYSEHPKVITYENAFRLPGYLEINEDITDYPVIEDKELPLVFQQMAQIIPSLSDFEQNLLSFWILDVVIEGMGTAQSAKMDFESQKATLLWIAYFFNYIQKQNPSRQNLFQHLKIILFRSNCTDPSENSEERCGEFGAKSSNSYQMDVGEYKCDVKAQKTWDLPLPPDLYVKKKKIIGDELNQTFTDGDSTARDSEEILSLNTNFKRKEWATETNVGRMNVILDILYRIFARLWVFIEIQTVFHAMPTTEQVDLPFTLRIPKPLLKQEPPTPVKAEKGGRRPTFSEKSFEDVESARQLHKFDCILPLQMAEESKLYIKQLFSLPASQRSVLDRNKEEKNKK